MGVGAMYRHGVMAERRLRIEPITTMNAEFAPYEPWEDHPGRERSALASALESREEHPDDSRQGNPPDEEGGC